MNRRRLLHEGLIVLGSIQGECLAPLGPSGSLTHDKGRIIIASARRLIGVSYRPGAPNFPKDVDCSRLTQWAFSMAELVIPRTVAAQFLGCTHHSTVPGALVYFNDDAGEFTTPSHVGINVGQGWMINGNRIVGKVIEENWRDSAYWMRRFVACATF